MRTSAVPFDRFATELLRLYDPPHRAPATRRQVKKVLALVAELGAESTADLTPVLCARFIETRPPGQSPRTLQTLLRVLRGICNQAVINGYLRVSPFALRRVSQWVGRIGPPLEKKHFSRAEIRRVLTLMAADVDTTNGWSQWRARRLYALTATVAYTGIRNSVALYLHAADVDLTSGFVSITDRGRDGGYRLKTEASAAPIPIPEALMPILRDWLTHRLDTPLDVPLPIDCPWLFPNMNRRSNWRGGSPGTKPLDRLRDVAKRAGVEGLTFLALRHSFASHLEAHGAGPAMIQRLLRHSNPTTQMWYRHADRPGMTDAVSGFDF